MLQRIGITCLVVLCGCSTTGPLDSPDDAGSTAQPAPESTTLPSTERLHPEPVSSVADVPGSYVQPYALPGEVSLITLAQPNWGTGSYSLYRSCGLPTCVPEAGQYSIIATNPAVGFAALSLVDQTGTVRVTYVLDNLWRDSHGALVAVQLRPLLANTPGPTQFWWRVSADATTPASPPAEPAPTAATTTHAALAGTFVRALPIYGDIDALTITGESWSGDTAHGGYTAAYPYCLPWCFGESGDYELDLANAATGTGHLSLVPTGNALAAHDYAVYAIWRAPDDTAAAIQLQRIDGVTPSGPLFTLYRQWWTAASSAQP